MIRGSCHCGAVAMELAQAPEVLTDCNCSICRRLGTLWAYYDPADVQIESVPEVVGRYVRSDPEGDGRIAFHHCLRCGCTTHWRAVDPDHRRMGVNARLLPPEVVAAARIRRLDGAATWRYLDEPQDNRS